MTSTYGLYIGTYTLWGSPQGEGIYYTEFDYDQHKFTTPKLAIKQDNPSYLYLAKDTLLAVSEVPNGKVFSYRCEDNGILSPINQTSSGGANPVFLSQSGDRVFVANYGNNEGCTASAAMTFIGGDGILSHDIYNANYGAGSHGEKDRQDFAHVHSITALTLGDGSIVVYAADLGKDQIHIYHIYKESISIQDVGLPLGTGPRQIRLSSNGSKLYLACELKSLVYTFDIDPKTGHLKNPQSFSSTQKSLGIVGRNYPGALVLSHNQKYLYVSNRGLNTVSVFAIDNDLEYLQEYSVEGAWPRELAMSPDGQLLVVANQNSSTITMFTIEDDGKKLVYRDSANVPTPASIVFSESK